MEIIFPIIILGIIIAAPICLGYLSEKQKEEAKTQDILQETLLATKHSLLIIMLIEKEKKQNPSSFLCRSNLACCDTAFFACFVVLILYFGSDGNYSFNEQDPCKNLYLINEKFEKARLLNYLKFDKTIVSDVLSKVKLRFTDDTNKDIIDEMFENRMSFYDRIAKKENNVTSKLEAVLFEFEQIIKTDALNKGEYEPFSESSPLPMLKGGIADDEKCEEEVAVFIDTLLTKMKCLLKERN